MLKKILPHILIVLSVSLLVFFFIDQVNSAMGFINNQGTKIILCVQCFIALIISGWFVADTRRR